MIQSILRTHAKYLRTIILFSMTVLVIDSTKVDQLDLH